MPGSTLPVADVGVNVMPSAFTVDVTKILYICMLITLELETMTLVYMYHTAYLDCCHDAYVPQSPDHLLQCCGHLAKHLDYWQRRLYASLPQRGSYYEIIWFYDMLYWIHIG